MTIFYTIFQWTTLWCSLGESQTTLSLWTTGILCVPYKPLPSPSPALMAKSPASNSVKISCWPLSVILSHAANEKHSHSASAQFSTRRPKPINLSNEAPLLVGLRDFTCHSWSYPLIWAKIKWWLCNECTGERRECLLLWCLIWGCERYKWPLVVRRSH